MIIVATAATVAAVRVNRLVSTVGLAPSGNKSSPANGL